MPGCDPKALSELSQHCTFFGISVGLQRKFLKLYNLIYDFFLQREDIKWSAATEALSGDPTAC